MLSVVLGSFLGSFLGIGTLLAICIVLAVRANKKRSSEIEKIINGRMEIK